MINLTCPGPVVEFTFDNLHGLKLMEGDGETTNRNSFVAAGKVSCGSFFYCSV